MSTSKPFTAATNKLAYAQAFSRTSIARDTFAPERPARRRFSLLHRDARRTRRTSV